MSYDIEIKSACGGFYEDLGNTAGGVWPAHESFWSPSARNAYSGQRVPYMSADQQPAGAEFDALIARLAAAETTADLNALRPACGAIITTGGKANFHRLQGAFIKAKNRIRYSRYRRTMPQS